MNTSLWQEIFKDYKKPEKDLVGRMSDAYKAYTHWAEGGDDPVRRKTIAHINSMDAVPFGVVSPRNWNKFAKGAIKKSVNGNPFWKDTLDEFYAWYGRNKGDLPTVPEYSNNRPRMIGVSDDVGKRLTNIWDRFTKNRGYEVGYEDIPIPIKATKPRSPEYLWDRTNRHASNALENDLTYGWNTGDLEYEVDFGMPDEVVAARNVQQSVFGPGLQEGDKLYRGDRNYETALKALEYPHETGPHHSVEDRVAAAFLDERSHKPLGQVLFEHEWAGKGKGYPLRTDLGHSSPQSVAEALITDNALPRRYIEDLKDLSKRYADIKTELAYNKDTTDSAWNAFHKTSSDELAKILNDAGYDHLTYMNTAEGPGNISIIPLGTKNLKPGVPTYMPDAALIRNSQNLWTDDGYKDYMLEEFNVPPPVYPFAYGTVDPDKSPGLFNWLAKEFGWSRK